MAQQTDRRQPTHSRWIAQFAALCLLLALPIAPLAAQAPPTQGQIAQWTLLIYLDGDNNLERAAVEDFLEMARVGSSDEVQVVVQFDRTPGYDRRYGDWQGTLRFHITPGLTPEPANALADLGEANMGDVQTLIDFYQWGKTAFPAHRTSLVLWNHGDGWRANAVPQDTRKAICWDQTELDSLDLAELRDGLAQVTRGGAQPIDVMAFDACLMAMIEIDTQIQPYVRVRVASEETEPATGYPYHAILDDLQAHPTWDAAQLAQAIVTHYYETYHGETQSAVDLGAPQTFLVAAVDGLAQALLTHRSAYPVVRNARLKAQTFQGEYVDLYDLAERIAAGTREPEIQGAARAVLEAQRGTVIHQAHGPYWPGAHGTSIYFPAQIEDWDDAYRGDQLYLDFTTQTRWDEFLVSFLAQDQAPELALSGQVKLQGRSAFQGTQITAQPYDAPDVTSTATTAQDGTFDLTARQPCTVTAHHPGYLDARWGVDEPGASRHTLPQVVLLGGDMNGDAQIDILDIAYLGARFESQDALADLNQDGTVNILDLVLAAANYGQSGQP